MELDLKRLHEIFNKISFEEELLSENGIFVNLLGNRSNYYQSSLEHFLDFYSFKINKDSISVFNDDGIPWENYTNGDFSDINIDVLKMSNLEVDEWIKNKVETHLKQLKVDEIKRIENIKLEIIRLQKELDK